MIRRTTFLRQAGARRIDDDDVGAARPLDQLAQREAHVAREEARVVDAVEARVAIASATASSTSSTP